MDSILASTKKLAGLTGEYAHFDPDIIMYINSVFLVLKQLGVGPSEGFCIQSADADETWDDFWQDFLIDNYVIREAVKAYMGQKVRLKFDPPANSTLLQALKDSIAESEHRLRDEAEFGHI